MPRPNKLHDELDALLDGRPVELTEELAPLVEAADVLRAELASYELDPEVADRHLELVLGDPATVVPLRPAQPAGWEVRRRVVAIALAAALVLAPATIASAAALPGQPMYPFKLAIEQLRLASVQWSPIREAGERTRVADTRQEEVNRLVDLRMFNQLPPALKAMFKAVAAAQQAVLDAESQGAALRKLAALRGRLQTVEGQALHAVRKVQTAVQGPYLLSLSPDTREEIEAAVAQSGQVLPLPAPPTDPLPSEPAQGPPPTTASLTSASSPPQTTVAPPNSTEPEPVPETTTAPPTTTTAPPTTTAPTTTTPPPTTTTETPAQTTGVNEPPADQAQDEPPPSTITP
jgi:hypothetical protein